MKINLQRNVCIVTREPGDPRISGGSRNAAGESRFLYAVKKILNAEGHDLIKKRMWKDGHMMDDLQQYLRTRNRKVKTGVMIFNGSWAIEGADEIYNRGDEVRLIVERWSPED